MTEPITPELIEAARQEVAGSRPACGMSLVLLMDGSGSIFSRPGESMDSKYWDIQVNATADAISDPEIVRKIEENGGIGVMAQSFDANVKTMVPWHVIRNQTDAEVFAQALRTNATAGMGGTDIGGAIGVAASQFPASPCPRMPQVIDISTDGESDALAARRARDAADKLDIQINALGVGSGSPQKWLEHNVKTPSGFAMNTDWNNYRDAIKKKLSREIASR